MIIDIFLTSTNIPLLFMEISRGYCLILISRIDIQYPLVPNQKKLQSERYQSYSWPQHLK